METTLRRKNKSLRKAPRFIAASKILVGGGDDPRFEPDPLVAAQGADFMLLERAQQPRLQLDGQFADFIQEDGSRTGRRQQSLPRLGGPGESAFDVPEQLAFNQGGRQRPAIHRDEGLIAPGALRVDGPRHQLFARAAFAHDQNRVPLQRHFGNQPVNLLHPLGDPDQARKPCRSRSPARLVHASAVAARWLLRAGPPTPAPVLRFSVAWSAADIRAIAGADGAGRLPIPSTMRMMLIPGCARLAAVGRSLPPWWPAGNPPGRRRISCSPSSANAAAAEFTALTSQAQSRRMRAHCS